jgi:hypothetical protein
MSTLKVNAIEPYSGGTVTITGATIESASYATTASFALNAGDPFPYTGNAVINGTLDVLNGGGLTVSGSQILGYDGVRAENFLFVNNGNVVQARPDGVNAHIFQNEDFFTSFYGTDLFWRSGSGVSGLVMGELNDVELTMNAFTPDFSTDHLFQVKSTLASGTVIGDWAGSWMTVPENGTPVMKRGLTIEGLGDYADDAAAATGGVPVNGVYRTGSVLKIRVS